MNVLIKSLSASEMSAVRPIAAPALQPRQSAVELEIEELRTAIGLLQDELADRDALITDLRAEITAAHARGVTEGKETGRTEANDLQSARLALLEKSIDSAAGERTQALDRLQRYSALIARDCLEKILGNAEDRQELVGELVTAQVRRLEKAMLSTIRVSPDDFPDASLAELHSRPGISGASIVADANVPAGGCVMTLQLGTIDVGLGQQWTVLRSALERLAAQEDAA
jgi:flagellar biosynthesis/type III secretory pathway protein FliH